MGTVKQVRWKCPQCENGLLAPSRPRMNDVRRYCLPCSAKVGVLVMRTAPALDKQRQASKAKATAKASAQRKAQTARKKAVKQKASDLKWAGDMNIEKEAEKLWKLFEPYHGGRPLPKLDIRDNQVIRGNLGWAHVDQQWRGIVIKKMGAKDTWMLLLHELGHMAVGVRHNNGRRSAHDAKLYKAMKDVAERRWKTNISFYEVTSYGYVVDGIISKQIAPLIVFPPRHKPKAEKQVEHSVA